MAATKKDGHLDKKKVKRQGYFEKQEDGMPRNKDYRKSCENCGKGFHGARWDAHHVLPQTSITQSVLDLSPDKRRYVSDVQYITDWVINDPVNMIGLPQFTSYLFYYQYQDSQVDEKNPRLKMASENGKVKRYINTFNNNLKKTRNEWLARLAKENPENHPIHRPVSWGHTDYNIKVKKRIKTQIWDPLDEKQKDHELDAETVKDQFNEVAKIYANKLIKRGKGANREKWDMRYDKDNKDWYKPFTMENVPSNPLFG